jgi:quercetin dioxygenase-like cupin family protein
MELKRVGTQPSQKGPADFFTGIVRIDPLNAPPPPARVSSASVTFEPGARSAWHSCRTSWRDEFSLDEYSIAPWD